nr:MAG TPA: hypothetical protein [Caudoviricetes sp.]
MNIFDIFSQDIIVNYFTLCKRIRYLLKIGST